MECKHNECQVSKHLALGGFCARDGGAVYTLLKGHSRCHIFHFPTCDAEKLWPFENIFHCVGFRWMHTLLLSSFSCGNICLERELGGCCFLSFSLCCVLWMHELYFMVLCVCDFNGTRGWFGERSHTSEFQQRLLLCFVVVILFGWIFSLFAKAIIIFHVFNPHKEWRRVDSLALFLSLGTRQPHAKGNNNKTICFLFAFFFRPRDSFFAQREREREKTWQKTQSTACEQNVITNSKQQKHILDYWHLFGVLEPRLTYGSFQLLKQICVCFFVVAHVEEKEKLVFWYVTDKTNRCDTIDSISINCHDFA